MNHLLASFILVLIVSASSLPVVAMDPEEEENGAAARGTATVVDASSQAPLENMFLQDLPFEMQEEILLRLSPKEVGRVARTSKAMRGIVSDFRAHCQKTYQAHVRAGVREGICAHESNPAGYGLPMFATPKSNIEKNIDSDMLKHLSPQQLQAIWAEFEIFAATVHSPIYAVADRMANYQKANMADVMLAAMYSAQAPPSYLEKAAIHHLFSAYTVFHKRESLTKWQQQVLSDKKERLQQFIAETYVEFEPGQVPAVSPDQKLMVKRGQLDTAANIAALDGIFQPDHPQPEMVLDFNGRDQIARLCNENLPAQLTNLAIINSGGAVTAIGDDFLLSCQSLETLTLSLPQVTQIGDWFLFSCQRLDSLTLDLPQLTQVGGAFLHGNQSLNTLTLSFPQVMQVGDGFLSNNQNLETLTLSLPQLMQVGDGFLSNNQSLNALTLSLPQLTRIRRGFLDGCKHLITVDLRALLNLGKVEIDRFMERMIKLEHVLIDARQEEFFKELLKDKPDLLSKFVIA